MLIPHGALRRPMNKTSTSSRILMMDETSRVWMSACRQQEDVRELRVCFEEEGEMDQR